MSASTAQRAFSTLRRLAERRPQAEACELCGGEMRADHEHLLEPAARRLLCVCVACSSAGHGSAGTDKLLLVPKEVRRLSDFRLADDRWGALMIPIDMAFFTAHRAAGRVIAAYPSPAGATESLLELDAWQEIVADNPILRTMRPDVEALLVNRLGMNRPLHDGDETVHEHEYYLAPIDECYRLVGVIRSHWQGFGGGPNVWGEIRRYFSELRARAQPTSDKASRR